MDERLRSQIDFIIEVDKMKNILRQTLLCDGSRRETDAEHSWHIATMALILHEQARDRVRIDPNRAVRMCLVHDLVEIYAGDTFAFDPKGNEDKAARENAAAIRLFGMLPADQGGEIEALWREFDRAESPDARFAAALDRLQPFLSNSVTGGHTWKLGKVDRKQVMRRIGLVEEVLPGLWPFVLETVETGVREGWIGED